MIIEGRFDSRKYVAELSFIHIVQIYVWCVFVFNIASVIVLLLTISLVVMILMTVGIGIINDNELLPRNG